MSDSNLRDDIQKTIRRDSISQNRQRDKDSFLWKYDETATNIFGDYFQERRDSFYSLQKKLRQSQKSIKVERYLSRIALSSTLAFISIITLGIILISLVSTSSGVALPVTPVVAFTLTILSASIVSIFVGFGIYIYPTLVASGRKREINYTLPYAITFMYALSRGGMNMIEILRILSESEDTYGETANEIRPVVRDIEYFSRDLPHALRRAARRSPSQKFSDFADDFVGVLTSGANLSRYLEDKSDEMLKEAERDQRNFIDTLELLGEVYVTLFVAGPLFLIIITVVMSMLGGAGSTQLDGIVYGLIPILNIGFFLLVDTISSDDADVKATIDVDKESATVEELERREELIENDSRLQRIKKEREKRERTAILREPIETLMNQPSYTLLFTVPVAAIWFTFILGSGISEPSYSALVSEPVKNTGALLVMPLFILCVPYSFFYEWNAWRQRRLIKRFPDALKRLASSNAIGMSLTESLENVAENTSGNLGEEFEKVKNDIEWKHDINNSLIAFANRVKVPVISRTIKLITEANKSTGDIEDVLEVAAKNVITRQKLKREREQSLLMYTVVIIISFFVYLFVIGMLDTTFLSEIEQVSEQAANASKNTSSQATGSSGSSGQFNIENLPVQKYRMVFYHSALIQGMGSGLLAGYLKNNDVRAGLKYFIVLAVIATIAFALL